MVRDDDTFTKSVVLRSSSSAHHLQDVLRAQLNPFALFWAIDLCALDDNCVSGQVDTPCQRSCRTQNLEIARSEQILDHLSIPLSHSCVMDSESEWEYVFKILRVTLFNLREENLFGGTIFFYELAQIILCQRHVSDDFGSPSSFLT